MKQHNLRMGFSTKENALEFIKTNKLCNSLLNAYTNNYIGKYLIRPNVELANKAFDKKTFYVDIHIDGDRLSNNRVVYATVPEVLQETVTLYYFENYSYENVDAGDGSYIDNYNRFVLTIEKGYSVSNKVPYHAPPAWAYVTFSLGYDSNYYNFELYEYI